MLRWVILLALTSGGCSWILPLNDRSEDGGSAVEARAGQEGGVTPDLTPTTDDATGDARSGEATVGPGDATPDAPVDCLEALGCTSGWCKLPTATTAALHDLWGSGVNDLWAVGEVGTVLRFVRDKCKWSPDTTVPTTETLLAVAGDGTTVFVGGNGGTLLEWTKAGGWVQANIDNTVPTTTDPVQALAVADVGSTKVAFAAGGSELDPTGGFIWKRTSGVWTGLSSSTARIYALSAGAGAVYAGGVGSLQVLDLSNEINGFQVVSPCGAGAQQQINGIWSTGVMTSATTHALVAVGFDHQISGRFMMYQAFGSSCVSLPESGTGAWNDVAGLSLSDYWLVGAQAAVKQKAGSALSAHTLPSTVDFHAVWVNPTATPKLVVVAGDNGEVWARTY